MTQGSRMALDSAADWLIALKVRFPRRRGPLFLIEPDARAGQPPCGECHLRAGETCDICGARQGAA